MNGRAQMRPEGGHLEVLQWARANGCPWNEWTCFQAAQCGHLDVLQWALANGCPPTVQWYVQDHHEYVRTWLIENNYLKK